MDDPSPISTDTDGTLYKRATRLPNGDWAPTTCCDCDGGSYPCSLMAGGSCWNIEISGVELNPNLHDLATHGASGGGGSEGLVECGAFFGNQSGPLNVVGASGMNRSFTAQFGGGPSGGFATSFGQTVYVVYDFSTSSPPYVATGSTDATVVEARLSCGVSLNTDLDRYPHWGTEPFDPDKVYVRRVLVGDAGLGGFADANPLGAFFFDANNPRFSRPVEVGMPIPNDSECFDLSGGRRGRRGFVNGTAIVTPVGTGSQPSCPGVPVFGLAARCGNELMTIPVDVETRTDGFYNCYYQGKLYRLTTESTEDQPFDVEWTADECPTQPDEWPLAVKCGGGGEITFDPADRPGDGVTIQVGSTVYLPVAAMSNEPPTAGVWSPDPCPPTDACADLILNDPRCSLPQYRDCPQCVGFDVGDPQPEPDFDLQDDGTIPGLGDMVAEAIRTISLNTILPCSACERRKQVLNRFGERAGRSILRILNW